MLIANQYIEHIILLAVKWFSLHAFCASLFPTLTLVILFQTSPIQNCRFVIVLGKSGIMYCSFITCGDGISTAAV